MSLYWQQSGLDVKVVRVSDGDLSLVTGNGKSSKTGPYIVFEFKFPINRPPNAPKDVDGVCLQDMLAVLDKDAAERIESLMEGVHGNPGLRTV